MGANIPKQFLNIGGIPILMHTIRVFKETDPDIKIILVLPENQHDYWEKLCIEHAFISDFPTTNGGETRFQSVKNGLQKIKEESLVAIHDGVRPFVSPAVIKRSFEFAEKFGNAIPAIPINESVRIKESNYSRVIDRRYLRIIQTPQTFKFSILRKAFQQDYHESFTDDATVVEALGEKINLIEGNIENIKITRKMDLKIAEALIR